MIEFEAHEAIAKAIKAYFEAVDDPSNDDFHNVAYAVIGALAVNGYAIIAVDPETTRRVVAEYVDDSEED